MLKPGVEWSYAVEPWSGVACGVVLWSGILERFLEWNFEVIFGVKIWSELR